MQINDLQRNKKRARSVQVGRGGTRGKTSGHGHKGQGSHAGRGGRPELRDFIKKLPKLRGRGTNMNKSVARDFAVVSLSDLEANFKAGDHVSPQVLLDAGLVRKDSGKMPPIKIIASGELKKKLTLKNVSLSAKAVEAVQAAKGEIK
jgi:large subunit ribosomal protein L15